MKTITLLKGRISSRGYINTARLSHFYLNQFLEHTTFQKFTNYVFVKIQKWIRKDRVIGMPYRYVIDPLNICNLKCPVCPTGLGILGRPRGKMKLVEFQNIIDQIYPYAYTINLYNWGEPFLHPDIFDFIQYASTKKVAVRISSNLNYFTQQMASRAVSSGLDSVMVSIDGSTSEVYQIYRKKGNLEKVLLNLKLLVKAKQDAGSSKPFIYVRMLINKYNEHQISDLNRICDEIGVDAFTVGTIFIDTTNIEHVQYWLPENNTLSYYDQTKPLLENVWNCDDLWESMTINWDGGVAPCCWLHQKDNDIGDIFASPVRDVWNSDPYVTSRRVFSFGGSRQGLTKTICVSCKGKPQYLKD